MLEPIFDEIPRVAVAPVIEHIVAMYVLVNTVTGTGWMKDPVCTVRCWVTVWLVCSWFPRWYSRNDLFGSNRGYVADQGYWTYGYPYRCVYGYYFLGYR